MSQRRVLAMIGVALALTATMLVPAGAAQEENSEEGPDENGANDNQETTTGSENTAPPPSGDLNGMDTEFGSIRMPVHREYAGDPVEVTARIILKDHYTRKDAKFFLFGFNVQSDSVDVSYDALTTADGQEIRVFKDQRGQAMQPQVWVDIRDMPPVGSEIVMHATVSAESSGSFQVGALVVAFDYHYEKVRMGNGLEAQLYGYTTLASNSEGLLFEGKGNVPGFSVPLVVTAVGLIAFAGARRRRRG